jgi:hypothetical protein
MKARTTGLKQFQQEEAAREARENAAKEEEISRPLREAARESSERVRLYWTNTSLTDLKINGLDMTPNDMAGDYALGPRETKKAEVAAYREFKANLESRGCTLTQEAADRLGGYLTSLAYHRGVSLTSVKNWETALHRLHVELDVFPPDSVTGYRDPNEQSRPTQPAKTPTVDELLEAENGNTYEGRKRMLDAVQKAAIYGDYARTWAMFVSSLAQNFERNGEPFKLTAEEEKVFYDTMVRRGMNFNHPPDYDRVRVALSKSGDLPNLLYPAERLDLEMEVSDLSDRSVRREFAQRSRALHHDVRPRY